MIEIRKRPLLEQADRLLKKALPEDEGEIAGQLMVARRIVAELAAEVRRLQPQQMAIR